LGCLKKRIPPFVAIVALWETVKMFLYCWWLGKLNTRMLAAMKIVWINGKSQIFRWISRAFCFKISVSRCSKKVPG